MSVREEFEHYLHCFQIFAQKRHAFQKGPGVTNEVILRKKNARLGHIAKKNDADNLATVIEGIAGVLEGKYEAKDVFKLWQEAVDDVQNTNWPAPVQAGYHTGKLD